MLGLGYPAAPTIEKFAEDGDSSKYNLPHPMSNSPDLNVSYSGLKTAAFKLIKALADMHGIEAKPYLTTIDNRTSTLPPFGPEIKLNENRIKAPAGTEVFILSKQEICDISASFQKAAIETIIIKLDKALKQYRPKQFLLGGGVVKNKLLRKESQKLARKYNISVHYPKESLIRDNAAMIGIAGFYQHKYTKHILYSHQDIESLEREPTLRLG